MDAERFEVRRVVLTCVVSTIWSRTRRVAANLPSTSSILEAASGGANAAGKAFTAKASARMVVNSGISRVAVTTYTWRTPCAALAYDPRAIPITSRKAAIDSTAPATMSTLPARRAVQSFDSVPAARPLMVDYLPMSSPGQGRWVCTVTLRHGLACVHQGVHGCAW
jgi:hypothetical protein